MQYDERSKTYATDNINECQIGTDKCKIYNDDADDKKELTWNQ
jgi:hypothetical protein